MGNGTLLFGNVVTLLESSSCKIMIQLLQNLFLRVSVQRLSGFYLLMLSVFILYSIVDIQSLGQEEDAPPPEPFEWDPNDE